MIKQLHKIIDMELFSVLMSVYYQEHPAWLRQSLDSVFSQTAAPAEVVLVEDGPLTTELEAVVADYERRHAELHVIRTSENRGLGPALATGLEHCSHELVARMDTDDIALPTRFERQLAAFEKHPDIDVCSTWINEFYEDPAQIVSVRRLPERPEELYEYGKRRNPANHVTVMFRKSSVIRSGGYLDYPLFEDYYLWTRMLTAGCRFYCLPEALQLVRTSPQMYARRGGFRYALTEAHFQFYLFGLRYISWRTFLSNLIIRFAIRILPLRLRGWLYRRALRRPQQDVEA